MSGASTRTMARMLGPFLIVFGAAIAARADVIAGLVPAFFHNPALVFVTAVFGLALGCIMVAAHTRIDSAAAIVITVFCWITLIRSAILLLAPQLVFLVASAAIQAPGIPLIPAVIAAAIGIWLTLVGWFATPEGSRP